jgi:putative DNA primase/helicase
VVPYGLTTYNLLEKLKKEASGILNWMLDGLDQWSEKGLKTPEVLVSATNAYKDDQDILAEWLDEQCERGGSYVKAELYRAYKWWCQMNGYRPYRANRFSRRLRDKGYVTASDNRTITGIELTDAAKKETMLATM